jgi:chromosome segregation ATPase
MGVLDWHAQLARLLRERNTAESRAEAQAQTIDALREALEELAQKLEQARSDRTTNEKVTKLIVYSQQLEAKLRGLQLLLDGARESEHQAQAKVVELKAALMATSIMRQAEVVELKAQRDAASNGAEIMSASMEKVRAMRERDHAQCDAQAQTIDALRQDLERSLLERDAMQSMFDQAQATLKRTMAEREAAEGNLETMMLNVEQTINRLDKLETERNQARSEQADLLAECDGLRSMLTQTERELQRLCLAAEAAALESTGVIDTVEIVALRAVVTALQEQRGGKPT